MKLQVGLSEKTFENVPCAICGDSKTRLLTQRGSFGWPTFVSICERCGLVYLNPRWTAEDYGRFYVEEYDQTVRADEDAYLDKEQRKAKIVWGRLQEYTPTKFGTVLDIGCGMGETLKLIGEQVENVRLFAIEPSDRYAKNAEGVIGAKVIARDVDSDWSEQNKGKFDLIVMRHVIEHLMDPQAALGKIAQSLTPDGLYYVATPDMMHPDGSLNDFWYQSVHTYYFSEITLTRLAARAGLEPVMIRSDDAELWGIFRRGEDVREPQISVYREQLQSLRSYKIRRGVRATLLLFSPKKISGMLPKSIKNLFPKNLKEKFRRLVYRH